MDFGQLCIIFQNRLHNIYGSRARGVNAEDSDLDLVALVDEKTPEIESALDDLAYGVMWDYDFKPVISLKVFSEARFRSSTERGCHFTGTSKKKVFQYDG